MRFNSFSLLFVLSIVSIHIIECKSKIVGLIAVRNESSLIKQCLLALSRYTDAIVLLDDFSTDDTLKIVESLAKQCKVEKIIQKTSWYRDEPGDKNKLIVAGRAIGGTHFICIDADEMFTANCENGNFLKKKILALNPGDKLLVKFYNLWRGIDRYRDLGKYQYLDCIFCDDGKCFFETNVVIHSSHIPNNLSGKTAWIKDPQFGVLHFQNVNWRNLLIKQAWYRCLERIRYPQKTAAEINKFYAASKDETGLKTVPVPKEWYEGYNFFDPAVATIPEKWREAQVLEWFKQYGKKFFSELDIWDINWGEGIR